MRVEIPKVPAPLPGPAPGSARRPQRCRRFRAYSLIEMLITVLIIQIISGMVVVNISSVEATDRLDRAANDVVSALRYARMLAMSSGANQPVGVEFNTNSTQNYIRVFAGTTQATVPNPMVSGGTYYVPIGNKRNTSSVRIASVILSGTTTNSVTYNVMGGTTNNGNIVLSYGNRTKVITVPLVGDPKIQ